MLPRRGLRHCRRCGAPVHWTITAAGSRLAVDAEPSSAGNTAVYRDGVGTVRSRRPNEDLPVLSYEQLHVPHVATCRGRAAREAGCPAAAKIRAT
ncbi:hypothetical protein ACIRBX_25415 [Kitasatospora sp. NPDC096147]|uniref:hypothetical protein n=1 Tax=Kitasatospora sp. NPDC096147 TaxID=3364093 RepID=UPI0038302031